MDDRYIKLRRKLQKRLDEQLAKVLGDVDPGHTPDINEVEKIVGDVNAGLNDEILSELMKQGIREVECSDHTEEPARKVKCEKCGHYAHFRATQPRSIVTMRGTARFRRAVYYCRVCNKDIMPADEALGISQNGYTRAVDLTVAKMGALDSYGGGQKLLQELTRIDISAKQIQIISTDVGQWAKGALIKQAGRARQDPELVAKQMHRPDVRVCISADGVHTPMHDGSYKEAKIGRVRVVDKEGKVLRDSYCHHMGGLPEFGRLLYGMVASVGAAECARTSMVSDGAIGLQRLLVRLFPHAKLVLDWYHACEYLYEVGRTCWGSVPVGRGKGKLSEKERETLMEEWTAAAKTAMWDGMHEQLMGWLTKLPCQSREARSAVKRARGYFKRNRERMQYPEYRATGIEIGSGHAEGACKTLVTERMKGAGMRWKEPGAQAVGTLRALYLSKGAWNQFMAAWPGRAAA